MATKALKHIFTILLALYKLKGSTFNLNATPDALPIMAVTACFAKGETRLENVPQARMKETDRISVMRRELTKLGAGIKELPMAWLCRAWMLNPRREAVHLLMRPLLTVMMITVL